MSMTLVWIIILVVSVIIEAITIDLVSIWFALGALIALVFNLFHISQAIQIISFIIVSVLCIVISRPLAKKYLRTRTVKTNLDRMIGKHCLVTETITANNKGEVQVMGNLWMATSLDNITITAGNYAQIIAIEGAHVVVKKI